jgi:hypothetical protein
MTKSSLAAALTVAVATTNLGGCASVPEPLKQVGQAVSNLGTATYDAGKAGVQAVREAATKPSDAASAPEGAKPEVKKAAGVTWDKNTSDKAPVNRGAASTASRAAASFAWKSVDGTKMTVTVSDGKKDSKLVLSQTGVISAPDCNRTASGTLSNLGSAMASTLSGAVAAPLKNSGAMPDLVRRAAPIAGVTLPTAPRTAQNNTASVASATAPYAGLTDTQKTACIANENAVKTAISAQAAELSKAFSEKNSGTKPTVTYTSTDGADIILGLNATTTPTRTPARN